MREVIWEQRKQQSYSANYGMSDIKEMDSLKNIMRCATSIHCTNQPVLNLGMVISFQH